MHPPSPRKPEGAVRLLYDGDCPFCRSETDFLRRQDRHGRLILDTVADPSFDPARFGLTREAVDGALHAFLPDGRMVTRMDAVRAAYAAVGRGWMAAPTGWPILRPLFDRAYRVFARNRRRWGAVLLRRL